MPAGRPATHAPAASGIDSARRIDLSSGNVIAPVRISATRSLGPSLIEAGTTRVREARRLARDGARFQCHLRLFKTEVGLIQLPGAVGAHKVPRANVVPCTRRLESLEDCDLDRGPPGRIVERA
jgi:hypothetical protein